MTKVQEALGNTIEKGNTKQQNFRPVQIQRTCRRRKKKKKLQLKNEICFGNGRLHFGKRRKCWLPAFSPFTKMFSKASFVKLGKSQDSLEEFR